MADIHERIAKLPPEKRALLLEKLNQQSKPASQPEGRPPVRPYSRDGGPLPLSFAQRRLWFLDQFEPGNAAYNLPMAIRLAGALDAAVLRQSLNTIVRRHEVLRTTYTTVDDQPAQVVAPDLELDLPLVTLSQPTAEEREAEAQRMIAQELRRPFDLAHGPLLRALLLRMDDEQHILLLTLHHIVSDGWSMGVLVHELAALYAALLEGRPAPLPEVPIQYADFAAWQDEWMRGTVLDRHLAYWKEHLRDAPAVLELPTDRPRPPTQTFHGAVQMLMLPKTLADDLRGLSQHEGVTLFMTLLAAFQTLLHRHTGQADIVVGSPIANRTQAELEGLIGCFVNTLVLRTRLDSQVNVQGVLKRVRETALGAYAHQDLPFEKLVEVMHPERDLSHSPLFQVLFALQNTPMEELRLPELTVSWLDVHNGTAQFDVSLYIWERADGLECRLEYNRDLFERATIGRLAGHFETLLAGIVARPSARLAELPLLQEAERRQLLLDYNATARPHPDQCAHLLIAEQAQHSPNAVALICGEHHLTYQALHQRAFQLAHHLRSLGVNSEDLVGICMERSPEMLIALLAVLHAGAAYLPLDPALPPARLDFLLNDARPAVLLTSTTDHPFDFAQGRRPPTTASDQPALTHPFTRSPAHPLTTAVDLRRDWPTIARQPATPPEVTVSPDQLCYTIYTSGSTGTPKGVQVCHAALANFLTSMREQPGLSETDVLVAVTTLSFDIAGLELFGPLLAGAKVVLASREQALDGQALRELLEREHATLLQATPATWRLLLAAGWDGSQHLRALCGGEALPAALAAELLDHTAELWNLYGPTETTIWSSLQQVTPDTLGQAAVPIGRGLANTQLYVLDRHLQPVPIGVVGELYIGGAGLARGYAARPDLTAERFVPNPFERLEIRDWRLGEADNPISNLQSLISLETRLYRTGDQVRYRADGLLEYVGRGDGQIKLRGFRIELGEIEALLEQHEVVQKAVVLLREDSPGDKRLVAYLLPTTPSTSLRADDHRPPTTDHRSPATEERGAKIEDGAVDATEKRSSILHPLSSSESVVGGQSSVVAELRAFLKTRLPEYMLPSAFVVLDALPLTPNGKIDRRALPAPDQSRPDVAERFVAPRNEAEARIATIWSEILGIEQIGIDDNFFDLGGESFKAVRVARKVGESVGVLDLFKHPTVRGLAEFVARGQPKTTGMLHELTKPVPATEHALSLVCIPFAGGSAIIYQGLAAALPAGFSLYALEMPGHDYSRRDEPLLPLEEVARRCVAEIVSSVPGPIALYGHCLGGALTIEIARLLEAAQVELAGIFMGGHFPMPRLPGKVFEFFAKAFPEERWTSKRIALEGLRAMGFFTDVLDAGEQDFVIRSFHHDARDTEDYYTKVYQSPAATRLRAPMLCIIGEMDRATELYQERHKEWEHFSDTVEMALIPGAGHYFLKHQVEEVARIIADRWLVWRDRAAPALPERVPAASAGPEVSNGHHKNGFHSTLAAAGIQNGRAPAPAATSTRPHAPTPGLLPFFLVALGQFVSLIGTGLTGFALGVWVYQQTGSISAFAFISVAALLPGILLAPIGGAVADRFNRRTVMILSDTLAACSTLSLAALLWTGTLQIWHIYLISGVGAIANAFQQPAYLAAVAQLVPKRYYGRANGIAQLGGATGGVVAPLLGGLLVLMIGLHGIVLIDVVTFLFAVSVTLLVRFPNTLFKKREEPFLREVSGGWRYIARRHGLVAIILFTVGVNYLFSIMEVLTTPLVLSLGSPAVLGTIIAANGAGLLTGSLVMSVWGGTRRRTIGIIACVALFGLSTIVIGIQPAPIFPAIGLFGIGLAIALLNAHWLSIVQTKVGLELQGRVMATNLMMVWSMMPLGYLTAGPLADRLFEPLMATGGALAATAGQVIGVGPGRGIGLMMILAGLLAIVLAVAAYCYRPIRLLEDDLPDAIPDAVIAADKDALQAQADRQLLLETA